MTKTTEKTETDLPILKRSAVIEGKGRPTVAELIAALAALPPEATVTSLATNGGETRPAWRVYTETTTEAIRP